MKKVLHTGFLLVLMSSASLYSQDKADKDTVIRIIKMWTVSHFGDTTGAEMDTTPDLLHLHNPIFRSTISSTWLGYLGSPYQNNYFADRPAFGNFFFNAYLSAYMRTPENTRFVNTRKPYSSFYYIMNNNKQKREEVLHFIHTQNVSKDLNFGFTLDLYSTNGLYGNQKSGNHILSFFSSLNRKHYFYYFTTAYNNFKRQENGGINGDSTLIGNETGSLSIPVNMVTSQAVTARNRSFTVSYMQGYRFPSLIQLFKKDSGELKSSINHIFRYDFNKRYYADAHNDANPTFYTNNLFTQVGDSVRNHNISNELQLSLGNFLYLFRLRASAQYDIGTFQYYANYKPVQFLQTTLDTTYSQYAADVIHNASVRLVLSNSKPGYLNWNFTGQNYLYGYNAGDVRYLFDATIKVNKRNDRLVASLLWENTTPSYGLTYFLSSRFRWDNDFSKINTVRLNGALVLESFKARIEGSYGILSNWIYFNESAVPEQTPDAVNIISLKAEKYLSFWKVRSRTRVMFQTTDRGDIIHIPRFSGFETLYFEHLFKFKVTRGTMLFQTGVDLIYFTSYKADSYMPATSVFYLQNTNTIGDFPFIDWFVNLKIKQATIFLKIDHVAYPWLGYEYFTANHYAVGQREFKIGLRWLFYD